MLQPNPGFEEEFRLSPKIVSAALAAAGLVLVCLSDARADPAARWRMILFALPVYVCAGLVWLLDRWKPALGRWGAVISLAGLVMLGDRVLGIPGFLTFLTIPTALAATLLSLPSAAVVAAGETLALLLPKQPSAGNSWESVIVALLAMWTTLAISYAAHRQVHELSSWLWEYFQRTQKLLEESRDRKAELAQAVADLTRTYQQLALANERMEAMRLIAEEAQDAKAAFVAKVSHEFRTPLNMIIALVDLVMESPAVYDHNLPPTLMEDLEIVRRNSEHLTSMINDVLDLSQAEAGRLALRRAQVDLRDVIKEAAEVVSPLLQRKRLDLQIVVPDELQTVYCDRTRIRQVVLNLLANAARFTEEGGVSVVASQKGEGVIVSVADTGPGIAPIDAERIFEPFWQGMNGLRHEKNGTGLGLSISKQFVELHGGRMWLEGQAGTGATFSFELPAQPHSLTAAVPRPWLREDWVWTERTSQAHLSVPPLKQRMIICDETGELYPALARYADAVDLVDTHSLQQAAESSRDYPAHTLLINAATVDRLTPLIEEARRKLPDTLVMGCVVPSRLSRALQAGAAGYLVKPVGKADLERAIRGIGRPVRRILLVDDSPDMLRLLTRMLLAHDSALQITAVSNGEQALDVLRSAPPDLMLLDIVMPELDGWSLLELKKWDEIVRDIPVVLVSAQDPAEQPLASQVLMATIEGGLSPSRLLRCSLDLSALLLKPD